MQNTAFQDTQAERGACIWLRDRTWLLKAVFGFDLAVLQDRDEVLARAAQAGVGAAIITGSSLTSSQRARSLVDSPAPIALYFTAGVRKIVVLLASACMAELDASKLVQKGESAHHYTGLQAPNGRHST